jgi:SepF-like predicted cell division protein (DUF552 family)
MAIGDRFRRMFGSSDDDDFSEDSGNEFIEIDLEQEKSESKIFVKTFVLKTYEDVNSVIDIRPLKPKDVVELKRAISKVKKTVEALEGRIAGFGENTVIATPSRVFEIQKGMTAPKPQRDDDGIEMF